MAKRLSEEERAAERAVVIRINRRIGPTHKVRQTRAGSADRKKYGRFYLVDYNLQRIVRRDLRLDEYAKRLSVAAPYQVRQVAAWKREDGGQRLNRYADVIEAAEETANQQAEANVVNWLQGWILRQVGGVSAAERFVIERLLDDFDRGASGQLVKLA